MEPFVFSWDASGAKAHACIEWPDGRVLGYTLDTTRFTDAPEVQAALAAPTPLPEAVLSLPAKWRADASKTIGKGGCVTTLDAAALTRCADELDAALRAIGGGNG